MLIISHSNRPMKNWPLENKAKCSESPANMKEVIPNLWADHQLFIKWTHTGNYTSTTKQTPTLNIIRNKQLLNWNNIQQNPLTLNKLIHGRSI